MVEAYYNFSGFNIGLTIVIFVVTIMSFFYLIKERTYDTLPTKINLTCKNCQNSNLSLHTQKINPFTESHKSIKFTLIFTIITLLLNLIFIVILLFNSDEMFTFLFEKEKFISDNTELLTSIVINFTFIKIQIYLLIINTVMKLFASLIKKDAIITICKDCGTVNSYFK